MKGIYGAAKQLKSSEQRINVQELYSKKTRNDHNMDLITVKKLTTTQPIGDAFRTRNRSMVVNPQNKRSGALGFSKQSL